MLLLANLEYHAGNKSELQVIRTDKLLHFQLCLQTHVTDHPTEVSTVAT